MISPDFTNSPGWTNFSAKRPFISNFKSAFFDGSSLPVYSTIGEIFFFFVTSLYQPLQESAYLYWLLAQAE